MSNKLVKNTFFYTLGRILPKAISFLLLPFYSVYLSPSDFGITTSMEVLSAILYVFIVMGMDAVVVRLYFDYKGEDIKAFLGTIFIGLLVVSTIITSICLLSSEVLGMVFSDIPFFPYYVLMILTLFLLVFSVLPLAYLQVTEQAKKFFALSFGHFIVKILFIIYFVIIMGQGAVGLLKGYFFGALTIFPIYIYISLRIVSLRFVWSFFSKALCFGIPLIFRNLVTWVIDLSDRVFIQRFAGLAEVGIYSLAYNLAALILVITNSVDLAYSPIYYKVANSSIDKQKKLEKLRGYNFQYSIIIIFTTFTIAYVIPDIVWLFMDERYQDAAFYAPILSLAYLFSQLSNINTLSFYQAKKTKMLAFLSVVAGALNICMNLILVSSYGATGAAISTTLTFAALFFMGYQFSKKAYFIPWNWWALSKISILLTALYIFTEYLPLDTHIMSLTFRSTMILLSIFCLHLMGLIDLSKLKGLLPKAR